MEQKKRVLVIVRSLKIGGMERVAVDLCDAFAEAGHEVHLLSFKKAKESIRPNRSDVHVHFFDFDLLNRLTVVGLVYETIARSVLNVVIRKSLFFWRGIYISVFFRAFLKKLERRFGNFDKIIVRGQGTFEYLWAVNDERIFSFVENVVNCERYARAPFLAKKLYSGKNLCFVSNGVFETYQALARELGITNRSLHVVPNPCPLERVRTAADELPADLPDEPYIVNVARLVKQKNHTLLLDAYKEAGIAEKLVLVGGGDDESKLKRYAEESGLTGKVVFLGMKKNPYPYMKHAKLFVLSSSIEGFGVVLVESLACGTPVTSVDCPGGIRDVLSGELERFVVPMSAKALAETIRRLVKEPPKVNEQWVERFEAKNIAKSVLRLS